MRKEPVFDNQDTAGHVVHDQYGLAKGSPMNIPCPGMATLFQ